MHFEHHREALGIDESQPRISWRFGGSVVVSWQQSACELEVFNGYEIQLRSFRACYNESFLVKWPSKLLTSDQRAQVRIRVYGQVPHRNGSYIRAKVPLNSKAQVVLPAAGKLFEVGSGVYFLFIIFFIINAEYFARGTERE